MPTPLIAGLLALLLSGGTVAASQSSMPGDALFPLKLTSENVLVALTPTDDAKDELRLELAKRRVDEFGEVVRSSGSTLDDGTRKGLDTAVRNMDSHLNDMFDDTRSLRSRGENERALESGEDLRATLAALELAVDANGRTATPVARAQVDSARARLNGLRSRVENELAMLESAENSRLFSGGSSSSQGASDKVSAAERKIADVERKLARNQGILSRDTVATAQTRLGEVKALVADARSDLANQQFVDAFGKARIALAATSSIKGLIELGEDRLDRNLGNISSAFHDIFDDRVQLTGFNVVGFDDHGAFSGRDSSSNLFDDRGAFSGNDSLSDLFDDHGAFSGRDSASDLFDDRGAFSGRDSASDLFDDRGAFSGNDSASDLFDDRGGASGRDSVSDSFDDSGRRGGSGGGRGGSTDD